VTSEESVGAEERMSSCECFLALVGDEKGIRPVPQKFCTNYPLMELLAPLLFPPV